MNMITSTPVSLDAHAAANPVSGTPASAAPHSLSERAMLVDLNISTWEARKTDKRVTDAVLNANRADVSAGRFHKYLLPREALAGVQTAVNAARQTIQEMTLPWTDTGPRILHSAAYFTLMEKMQRCRYAFEEAVDDLIVKYPLYVADAAMHLGDMFQPDEYPASEEVRAKFGFEIVVLPLPSAADFRVALSDDTLAQIRADIERQTANAMGAATRNAWDRIAKVAGHLAERLRLYRVDETGRVQNHFKESSVENLRELVEILPHLNVTGDPEMERVRQDLEKTIAGIGADDLRESEFLRESRATELERILDSMSGYCGDVR